MLVNYLHNSRACINYKCSYSDDSRSQKGRQMTEVSVVGPGRGRGDPAGPIADADPGRRRTTEHRLGVGEITLPRIPRTAQHRHARHDEGFYVVSGTARFTVGRHHLRSTRRHLGHGPPPAPRIPSPILGDEPAVLLNTFTPDLYVQYFRDLRDMIAGGQDLTPEATIAGDEPIRHRSCHRGRIAATTT